MALSKDLAKKIADAKTSGSGNRIKKGVYELEVTKVMCDKKYNGTMFIAEMNVLESEAADEKVTPNQPGTTCSVAFNLDKGGAAGDAAMGNTKQFVCALRGLDPETATSEEFLAALEDVVSERQPDRGRVVGCETIDKEIRTGKSAGTVGCFPKFLHVKQAPADVKARREALDKAS